MQAAKATPGILKMCGSQKLLDQLTECNKLLETVQKVHAVASVGTMAAHIFCLTWYNLLVLIVIAHILGSAWHNISVPPMAAHILSPTWRDLLVFNASAHTFSSIWYSLLYALSKSSS